MISPEEIKISFGPRGGDLNNPVQQPEARRAHFQATVLPDGSPGLHRFEKEHETAKHGIQNEQAWHRMAAYMLLVGRTTSEIAMAAGVHPATVSMLRAQKWFQELLATLANNEGDEITGILKAETAASIETLVSLRDYSENDNVRLNAARTIVEQSRGKPLQRVVSAVSRSNYDSPHEEFAALQEELKALRASRKEQT